MISIIKNAVRHSRTNCSDYGFVKLIVPALVAVSFLLSAAVAMAATINVNSDTEMVNLSGSDTININNCTLTLNNTENTTFSGPFKSTGNIIKTGSGTLTLTHPVINYKGTTTVSEGKLKLDGNNLALTFSSEIINNGVIETNCDQGFRNLSGTGAINVIGNSVDIDLVNTKDTTYSGSITGADTIDVNADVSIGAGTITLSGSISDVNRIIVGTLGQLKLTGAALDYNGSMTVFGGKSVEYEVASGTKRYNITNANKIDIEATSTGGTGSGKMIKSGDGTLQICCEADGLVRADSVFISSGRMDYQGYFESAASFGSPTSPTDCFVVEEGAVFSPGIGVGNIILNSGNFTIRDSAIALFEFDAYNEDPALQNFDTITINGELCKTVVNSNSIIQLAFANNDAEKWAKEGAEYHIITEGFTFKPNNGDYSYLLGNYSDYFKLEARQNEGFYLIGLGVPEPPMPVPEPSTWALLILGVAGLLYVRKRVRS